MGGDALTTGQFGEVGGSHRSYKWTLEAEEEEGRYKDLLSYSNLRPNIGDVKS